MTSTDTTPRRNQRKTPLTPKKRDREDESPPAYQPVRIGGGRIKKAKVPFDPSENNLPKRRITVFADSKADFFGSKTHKDGKKSKKKHQQPAELPAPAAAVVAIDFSKACTICSKQDKRLGGTLSCKECVAVGHLACIRRTEGGQHYQPGSRSWVCSSCETCVECYESSLMQPLYKCISCQSFYHLECNDPNYSDRGSNGISTTKKFRCKNCIQFSESLMRKSKELANQQKKAAAAEPIVKSAHIGSVVKKNLFSFKEDTNAGGTSKRTTEVGFAGFDPNELNSDKNLLLLSEAIDETVVVKEDNGKKTGTKVSAPPNSVAQPPPTVSHNCADDNDDGIEIVKSEPFDERNDLSYLKRTMPNGSSIAKWSKQDVYEYFLEYFPNEAIALKKKNIDGLSLQVMKRNDVVTGLEINLGPALRMYHHVLRLQTQTNDITLGWL